MPTLGGFVDLVLGIGDSIAEWVTFPFAGDPVTAVLSYLRVFISYLPRPILDLGLAAFGGTVLISILRSIGR